VNLLGDSIDAMKKDTETLSDASKEAGLEINVDKTMYISLSLFWFRPCAACQCLKHLIMFPTFVTP
jgi:hypothetical protein